MLCNTEKTFALMLIQICKINEEKRMNKQIFVLCLFVIRMKVPSRWVCSESDMRRISKQLP
jgi:hypothetical protein